MFVCLFVCFAVVVVVVFSRLGEVNSECCSYFLRTFTFCLISRPDTHGRNCVFFADSAVRVTHGVAIVTSEGTF